MLLKVKTNGLTRVLYRIAAQPKYNAILMIIAFSYTYICTRINIVSKKVDYIAYPKGFFCKISFVYI